MRMPEDPDVHIRLCLLFEKEQPKWALWGKTQKREYNEINDLISSLNRVITEKIGPLTFDFHHIFAQDNQRDLEQATEKLSEYLERDISAENLEGIKQKVQDMYR